MELDLEPSAGSATMGTLFDLNHTFVFFKISHSVMVLNGGGVKPPLKQGCLETVYGFFWLSPLLGLLVAF